MTIRTTQQSGPWSNSATWGGTAPVDGDQATVASGHSVTFDADMTLWRYGVLLTISATGALSCSTATGNYVLKLYGTASVLGVFNAGTPGNPLPSDVTFAIMHGSAAPSDDGWLVRLTH